MPSNHASPHLHCISETMFGAEVFSNIACAQICPRKMIVLCAYIYMKEEMANEATSWKSVAIQQLMQSPALLSSSSFKSSLIRKQQWARRRLALHKHLQSKKKAVLLVMLSTIVIVMLSTIVIAHSVPTLFGHTSGKIHYSIAHSL